MTFSEVEALPFPMALWFFEYWNEVNPPTSELLAAFVGFKCK